MYLTPVTISYRIFTQKLWCETYDKKQLTKDEVKRQNVIHELFQGEEELVHNLELAEKVFTFLLSLKIMKLQFYCLEFELTESLIVFYLLKFFFEDLR